LVGVALLAKGVLPADFFQTEKTTEKETMSANDIPADIADAIYRLRYVDKPITRIERAFLCGVLCAMQTINLAEKMRNQEDAEIIPFPKKPTEPDDAS